MARVLSPAAGFRSFMIAVAALLAAAPLHAIETPLRVVVVDAAGKPCGDVPVAVVLLRPSPAMPNEDAASRRASARRVPERLPRRAIVVCGNWR
ncbi:MAG: hypothetical protein EXS13_07925 [Planctomycetes bacterium]|nr:hypothetical protein [Planctomycetota bacterium]